MRPITAIHLFGCVCIFLAGLSAFLDGPRAAIPMCFVGALSGLLTLAIIYVREEA